MEAQESFWKADPSEIAKNYNGAGPDNLPAGLRVFLEKEFGTADVSKLAAGGRKILTSMLSLFVLAYVIHDWDYAHSDRTEDGFHAANNRMRDNMSKLLNSKYPVWNPLTWRSRAIWWGKAQAAYYACEKFGMSAWED